MITFTFEGTGLEFISSKRVLPLSLLHRFLMIDELEEIFKDFAIEQLVVDRRLLVNRQNLKKMYRVWFQGRFRKPEEGEVALDTQGERGIRRAEDALD
jgi:hypothetical protein